MQQYEKYREKEQTYKLYAMLRKYLVYDVIYIIIKLYHIVEPSLYNHFRVNATQYPAKQLLCIQYNKYSEKNILMNYIATYTNLFVFDTHIGVKPLYFVVISSSNFLFRKQHKSDTIVTFSQFYTTLLHNKKYNIDLRGCLCFNRKDMIVYDTIFNKFLNVQLSRLCYK
jgi:hypothetical protein